MVPLLLAVRFALELTLLATVGWLGYRSAGSAPLGAVFGVIAVAVIATVWGLFLSPRRRFDPPLGARIVIELLLFALASLGLWAYGPPLLGLGLFVTEVVVLVALTALGSPPGSHPEGHRPGGD